MIVEKNLLQGSGSQMIDGDLHPYPTSPVAEVRLSYTCLTRTRELRAMSRGIEKRLKSLENENNDHKDLILQEEAVLKAVCIEIRKREQMAFFSEFGIQ